MEKRSKDEWVREYSAGHQNPVNRACHTVGIPLIAISILLLPVELWLAGTWRVAAMLFVAGWVFQFVGHAFETEAARVLQGLALPVCRSSLVVRKDAGKA